MSPFDQGGGWWCHDEKGKKQDSSRAVELGEWANTGCRYVGGTWERHPIKQERNGIFIKEVVHPAFFDITEKVQLNVE